MAQKIIKIVLTGGPCAGKTTALAVLRQKLAAYGVRVFVVPELATELFTNGVNPGELFGQPDKWRALQANMIKAQIERETYWENMANLSGDEPKILICDRGILDQAAYIERDIFDGILHDLRLSLAEVSGERYSGVLHMVTAAKGAEEAYTLENNAARSETAEMARERDAAGMLAWQGHDNVVIIGNVRKGPSGEEIKISFEDKLEHVLQATCQLLTLPVPSRVERKYVVAADFKMPAQLPVSITTQLVEQVYLTSPEGVERRIKRMTPEGRISRPGSLYIYTEKKEAVDGGRLTTERPLSAQEYEVLMRERDPESEIIHKKRHTFIWQDQYFQLDEMADGREWVLEITQTTAHEGVLLPDWVPVSREVTGEKPWTSREKARKSAKTRKGPIR